MRLFPPSSFDTVYTLNAQFIVLFYYGRTDLQGQGFRLNVRNGGFGTSPKNPSFQTKNETFSLRYGGGSYADHEAFFVLGAPPEGKGMNATVSRIHTEKDYDWVTLFWVDPGKPVSTLCER